MRADIGAVSKAMEVGLQYARAEYGNGGVPFLEFMLGIQHAAIKDLCEHVAELEARLEGKES